MQENWGLKREHHSELKKIDPVARETRRPSRLRAAVQPSSSQGEPNVETESPELQGAPVTSAEEGQASEEDGVEVEIDLSRPPPMKLPEGSLLCTSITATKMEDALRDIRVSSVSFMPFLNS